MKAAVFYGMEQGIRVEQVPDPQPGPGDVLVRVAACGLCHTDLHYIDHGTPTFQPPPIILGHEISGTVAAVGGEVTEWQPGDRVLLPAVVSCGTCCMCRTGRENICMRQRMFGNHMHGGYAEYVIAPARDLFALPETVPLAEGAIIADALTTPYHAVIHRGEVRPGDTVAVLGCGGIGLNVVQMAHLVGAQVIAIDIVDRKLELARQLGAAETINARTVDAVEKWVRKRTDGGADVVFECIGHPQTQVQALRMVRTGGRVVFVGFSPEPATLPTGRVMFREIEIRGTLGCRPVDYPRVIELVAGGRLQLHPLISHRFSLDDIHAGLDALRRGDVIRAIVIP